MKRRYLAGGLGASAVALTFTFLMLRTGDETGPTPQAGHAPKVDANAATVRAVGAIPAPRKDDDDPVSRLVKAGRERNVTELDRLASELLTNNALSRETKFKILWAAYRASADSSELARYFLESLLPLCPLPEIGLVVDEFTAATDTVVRKTLIRLLGATFDNGAATSAAGTSTQRNDLVLTTLRSVLKETRGEVAREAMLAFARIGPATEVVEDLRKLRAQGDLGFEDYVRELSIQLPAVATPEAQVALARMLVDAGANGGERQVALRLLLATLQNSSATAALGPGTRAVLTPFLANNEPVLRNDPRQFDFQAAVDYSHWAIVLAQMDGAATGNSAAESLLRRAAAVESEKLVAILLSPAGKEVADLAISRGWQEAMTGRLRARLNELAPGSVAYQAVWDGLRVLAR